MSKGRLFCFSCFGGSPLHDQAHFFPSLRRVALTTLSLPATPLTHLINIPPIMASRAGMAASRLLVGARPAFSLATSVRSAASAFAPARAGVPAASSGRAVVFARGFAQEAQAGGAAESDAAAAGANKASNGAPEGAGGGAGGAADPREAQVKELTAKVTALEAKVKELEADKLYKLAEMETVRRIARKDVDTAKQYAAQPIAKGLLLAIDNISSAIAAVPEDEAGKSKALANLLEGIRATHRIFLKVLGEHGVKPFGEAGDKFDANKYEAFAMVPAGAAGKEPNTVANVMQVGYMFKDRVLRPAQVAVFTKG